VGVGEEGEDLLRGPIELLATFENVDLHNSRTGKAPDVD
jgi:hypothetical protein